MDLAEILVAHRERAVVRAGEVYLKVETDRAKAEREHVALELVPVPVPEVLWWRPGSPSLLALGPVAGKALSSGSSADAWVTAGRMLAGLHAEPPPDWEQWWVPDSVTRRLDEDRAWWGEHDLVSGEVLDRAHQMAVAGLVDRDITPALTHGDLQPNHVFLEGEEIIAVIDWGDVGVGDPLYDLAVLTSRDKPRLDAVRAGYGPMDRAVVAAWWAARHLSEVRWLVEHGYDATEPIAQLEVLVG